MELSFGEKIRNLREGYEPNATGQGCPNDPTEGILYRVRKI